MLDKDIVHFISKDVEGCKKSVEKLSDKIDKINKEIKSFNNLDLELNEKILDMKYSLKELKDYINNIIKDHEDRICHLSSEKIIRDFRWKIITFILMSIGGTAIFWLGSVLDTIGKDNSFINHII